MSTKNQDFDLNELAISLDVDNDLIERVRNGQVTHIGMSINEQNQNMILENVDGNLILDVEELPDMFHGCYFYNDGIFPYIIKHSLSFLVLSGDKDDCLVEIIGVQTQPGTRFTFGEKGKPSVENPNGDSCIWNITFEVLPVTSDHRHYLMRWNPTISSFTESDYSEYFANMERGSFRLNWSIFDWQEARKGDFFYMLRSGDDKAGIVFAGRFLSDPYPADDWNGSSKRRMYVDLLCQDPIAPNHKPRISLAKLQKTIPSVNWASGHSGESISEDVVAEIEKMFKA